MVILVIIFFIIRIWDELRIKYLQHKYEKRIKIL
jgi:hypothetical protein